MSETPQEVLLDGRSNYEGEANYINLLRNGILAMAADVCNIAAAYGSFEDIGMTQEEVEQLGNGKVIENQGGRRFFWQPNGRP